MFQIFNFSIGLTAVIFVTSSSCNNPNKTSISKSNKNELVKNIIDSVTNPSKENVNELALSPVIIKSALTPGYYSYTNDTSQISQYIRRIFQDSKGNFWLGTVGDGVCCYNGTSLNYYSHLDGFGGNSVQDIAEDKNGNIWFATSGGVSKYEEQKFTNYTEKDGLSDNQILSLCIDKSENIWVGTAKGICRYAENKFIPFSIPESGQKLEVKNIMEDNNGNIWFATNGAGAYCYNGTSLTLISEKDGLGSKTVYYMLQDRKGHIWFATQGGGVVHYNPAEELRTGKKLFINYKEEKGSNEAWYLLEDKTGNIWTSVRGSVKRYDGKIVTTFSADDGLTNCCVQSIYEDKAGTIWFGSGAGLFRYDPLAEIKSGKAFINVTKKGPWLKNR